MKESFVPMVRVKSAPQEPMRRKSRENLTRFTTPLEPAENALLLALQSHLQRKQGKAMLRAEVMRLALRHFAAAEGVTANTQ